jgi:hypothetical protein
MRKTSKIAGNETVWTLISAIFWHRKSVEARQIAQSIAMAEVLGAPPVGSTISVPVTQETKRFAWKAENALQALHGTLFRSVT